ncbi:MAG: SpoIIIAH-like family protein [Ruminococcaceae bacterium]|nr:SpoIIIAH-like family protein [Oscillospiraceae bacterium]
MEENMNSENKFKVLWRKVKNYDYKKLLNSKAFLGCICLVLVVAAVGVSMLIPNGKDEDDEAGKILGNPILVGNNQSDVEKDDSYFSDAMTNREKARDEAIAVLQTIVDSGDALADTKEQALADIAKIVEEMTMEANIEALIKAKGFSECVTVISGDKANVIVKSDGLLETEVAQIAEIVYSEAGITPANITLVEKA